MTSAHRLSTAAMALAMAPGCVHVLSSDRTPHPYDFTVEGIATVVGVTTSERGPLLTFDFQATSWASPERQAPVAAADIVSLPPDLALAPGATLTLRGSFTMEQIGSSAPYATSPPFWSYLGAP